MKKPYVGITGPVTVSEVDAICTQFSDARLTRNHCNTPMLGFLVSYKTLNGQEVANRRYPAFEFIPELVESTSRRVLPMIHYNSKEQDTLARQVARIFQDIPGHALQLNVVWPDIAQVKLIREQFPEMDIVFQASRKVLDGRSPPLIAEGIKNYGDSIDYVLIDPSDGRGKPFDVQASLEIYNALREQCPHLTIGFAGGFTGANVADRLYQLIARIGNANFCIDAEGGLRDKVTDAYGDDLLNMQKVKAYLQAAAGVLV
ncbi:hypothetical protein KY329_02065 [Candidatus Woesearchaeota archaeon]|nr:hypothetical protein [Candidatus Woesearchaeota archaeon]